MAFPLIGQGLKTPIRGTRERVTWYVRNSGSDIDGDGSEEFPFATPEKGFSMLVDDPEGKLAQRVDLSTFQGDLSDSAFWSLSRGPRRVELDFANDVTVPHTDFFAFPVEIFAEPTVLRTVTITGVSQDAITTLSTITISETLVPDELAGTILFRQAFQQGVVQSNTANTITVAGYGGAFPNGEATICVQSCTLNYGNVALNYIGMHLTINSMAAINGIRFGGDNSTSGLGVTANEECYFNACRFDGLMTEPASRLITFLDCYFDDGAIFMDSPYDMQGCVMQGASNFTIHGSSGAGKNSMSYCIFDGCSEIGGGNFEQNTDVEIFNSHIMNSTGHGVGIQSPFNSRISNVRIDDSAGSAISSSAGAILKVRNVVGSGNADYGMLLANGSQCLYQGGCTVSGTDGEVKVGGSAASLWADGTPRTDVGETAPEFCRIYS